MGKLKAKQRNALPGSKFAGPNRSFPIPDASHARQALRERKFAPDPSAIVSKVESAFPGIQPRAMGGPVMPGQAYIGGENGPEVFTPKVPGVVSPNPGMKSPKIPGLKAPRAAVQGPRGPQGPRVPSPSPRGIRGTTDFKQLMSKLKTGR